MATHEEASKPLQAVSRDSMVQYTAFCYAFKDAESMEQLKHYIEDANHLIKRFDVLVKRNQQKAEPARIPAESMLVINRILRHTMQEFGKAIAAAEEVGPAGGMMPFENVQRLQKIVLPSSEQMIGSIIDQTWPMDGPMDDV